MDHVDVLIVGAGLSGIGAAVHLQDRCAGKSYAILEGRDAIGGTWDLFRYPGIRSDSDMHTLGYSFKPWREAKAIADGPSIRKYVTDTATEHKINQHIRFGHKLTGSSWSSDTSTWTVTAQHNGNDVQLSCNFLFMCSGYYNYEDAFTPEFAGMDDYQGQVIHPQHWPEGLDYSNKKVIVIGSGATAMTLVPAMANKAQQVTMVQRSPTYVVSRPSEDKLANRLRKFLPEKMAYAATRFKNVTMGRYMYNKTRTAPEKVKKMILKMVRAELGDDFDVDKHFTPSYNPWDQRLCLVPDSDLFKSLKSGKAAVVTDEIECFTASGLRLRSGQELDADIIITATGLNLKLLGGAEFSVDGEQVSFPDTFSYKGMLYSDVPNLVQTFGYINASWTLRADLTAEYVCRLLNHMDSTGTQQVVAKLRDEDKNMKALPWIMDFSAGYMQRMMHKFPKQGDSGPWRNTQDYAADKKMIRNAPLEDGALQFSHTPAQSAAAADAGSESTRDAA
jgi:monooxygenase